MERRTAEAAVAILVAAEEAQAAHLAQSPSSSTLAPSSDWSPGPSPLLTWRLRGLELALNAAMLLGDWPGAANHGQALVAGRQLAYGTKLHPRVGLDLVTLGGALHPFPLQLPPDCLLVWGLFRLSLGVFWPSLWAACWASGTRRVGRRVRWGRCR